jgi:hypothetical protein
VVICAADPVIPVSIDARTFSTYVAVILSSSTPFTLPKRAKQYGTAQALPAEEINRACQSWACYVNY